MKRPGGVGMNLQCISGIVRTEEEREAREAGSPCILMHLLPQVFSEEAKVRPSDTLGHIVSPSHHSPLCN